MGLFSRKPLPEPPAPSKPIPSEEFSKLQTQIIELSGKIGILGAEYTKLEMEIDIIKRKIKYDRTKTPEDSSPESSGLPKTPPKGLYTFNPFA